MIRFSHTSGRYLQALATIFLVSAVSGCASFQEVKSFASLSSNAASHDALTKDYIGALDRRKQYQPEKFHAGLDAQKVRREAQRASLDLLQQSVTDYMQGLNGLATGDVRPYDRSLKDLSSDLNKATLLTYDEKEAVGALSIILARAVTAVYRLHEIRKLIHDGNQPLQDVISATRKIVMKGIIADLQVESALVGRYYDNFMRAPDNPVEPVAMALAKEVRTEALGRVNSRIRSARSYDNVLEKIAQGHQYLYDNRDMVGNKEFDRQLKPYVDELRAAYRNLLDGSP
ncbi:hypothetical protein [Nitrosovibrio sp. Nv6]|uniref:hypothetical protein n=1 Tax=Nitrosovibrio sp. Nv6 TaxID=1855340 RepID=UPI0008CDFA42|nr:hypothetical protein [Nitrosovibrio sp. Nv6]SEO44764.1 hypothetical protein SAMN05216316_0238 [Nitrosovibrio sp. Nv6]